jgi:hypothetical protein
MLGLKGGQMKPKKPVDKLSVSGEIETKSSRLRGYFLSLFVDFVPFGHLSDRAAAAA